MLGYLLTKWKNSSSAGSPVSGWRFMLSVRPTLHSVVLGARDVVEAG